MGIDKRENLLYANIDHIACLGYRSRPGTMILCLFQPLCNRDMDLDKRENLHYANMGRKAFLLCRSRPDNLPALACF